MWGVVAYDPADPWVVVDDDAGQQRLHRQPAIGPAPSRDS
jgi:hypothetical protein